MYVASAKEVITRKDHQCFSCLRKFEAPCPMVKWSGVYEGEWNSGYTCLTCEEIHQKITEDFNDGIPEGFVNECLERDQTPEEYLIDLETKIDERTT